MIPASQVREEALRKEEKTIERDKIRLFNRVEEYISNSKEKGQLSTQLTFVVGGPYTNEYDYNLFRKESVDFVIKTLLGNGYKVRKLGWFQTIGLEISW